MSLDEYHSTLGGIGGVFKVKYQGTWISVDASGCICPEASWAASINVAKPDHGPVNNIHTTDNTIS